MNNKIVLVTGSSSGIGEVIAERFINSAYEVLFHGVDDLVFEVAAKYSKKYSKNFKAFKANLKNTQEIEQMMEGLQIDILVNNAGIQYVSPLEDFPLAKWNDILAINLTAPFYLTQLVWPSMKKNKFGRIINISSVHGIRASEFKSAYVSAKHGLNGLTKALALEGANHGITVNAICPGYVKTPLVEGQIADQAKAHNISQEEVISKIILKKQAVKDFINPEVIADMVLLLAQEKSSALTGAEYVLDGGWSVQ